MPITDKQKLAIKAICYACKDNNPDYFEMREYVEWKKPFTILEKISYCEAIEILEEMIKEKPMLDKILQDENIDDKFKKQIQLYRDLEKNVAEFAKLKQQIKSNEELEGSWRNTKFSYWKDICLKYDENDILNCYGDIFFIDENNSDHYIGRRILWNLELSKEQYYIKPFIETDAEDRYDYTDYEITVIEKGERNGK